MSTRPENSIAAPATHNRGNGARFAQSDAAGAPASSRAARAAERRAAIVEAALEQFISCGFAATRLDDIAKRAGVAKGTIYLHFKDKGINVRGVGAHRDRAGGATVDVAATCGYRKSHPALLVVQSAQDRSADDIPGPLNAARKRGILVQ